MGFRDDGERSWEYVLQGRKMHQMELDLRNYDIFTDQMRPIDDRDLIVLKETAKAYGKIREACQRCRDHQTLLAALDSIHFKLQSRILNRNQPHVPD